MGGFVTPSGGFAGAPSADTRTATVVVAAYNSLHPEKADYQCDGVDDHVEIQAALDSLPSTGGQVILLDGTFNIQSTIGRNISNITIRGQGKSTILTTSTDNLIFFSFTGTNGSELTGITIADMQIDGANVSNCGIYFEYVDKSLIQNVCSKRHTSSTWRSGITLVNSDFNNIIGNTCSENSYEGIDIEYSNSNTIIGNICQGNADCNIYLFESNNNTIANNICQDNIYNGIFLGDSNNNTITGNICHRNKFGIHFDDSNNNTITGNICQGNNWDGIVIVTSNNNTITGNICQGNGGDGIYLHGSNNNTITDNICIANSQEATNTYDDIQICDDSNYNNIQGNTCRAGTLTNKPRYGINITSSDCDGNLVTNNDLYNDGFGTGSFNDSGTGTVTTPGNRT
jgi:parallel beta-helix repeat protein